MKQLRALDKRRAKAFWRDQFSDVPAIFPRVKPGYIPDADQMLRKDVSVPVDGVSSGLVPAYLEAAMACTRKAYSNHDNVVYGLVLSERDITASSDAGDAVGPSIVTVPKQVTIEANVAVRDLLQATTKRRRDISTNNALQYRLPTIKNVSDEARVACGFQTVPNIRSIPMDQASPEGIILEGEDDMHRPFALCFTVDINTDKAVVETWYDEKVIVRRQAERPREQFTHMFQALQGAKSGIVVRELPLLSLSDYADLLDWSSSIPRLIGSVARL